MGRKKEGTIMNVGGLFTGFNTKVGSAMINRDIHTNKQMTSSLFYQFVCVMTIKKEYSERDVDLIYTKFHNHLKRNAPSGMFTLLDIPIKVYNKECTKKSKIVSEITFVNHSKLPFDDFQYQTLDAVESTLNQLLEHKGAFEFENYQRKVKKV